MHSKMVLGIGLIFLVGSVLADEESRRDCAYSNVIACLKYGQNLSSKGDMIGAERYLKKACFAGVGKQKFTRNGNFRRALV